MGFIPTLIYDAFETSEKTSMDLQATYMKAVQRLLHPLAQSFVARGVTLPVLLPLMKQAMVQTVEDMGNQE